MTKSTKSKKTGSPKSPESNDLKTGKGNVCPESTDGKQRSPNLFKPGQSGNPSGRPKGSRHKLGQAFLDALHEDFQAHGIEAIQKVRTTKPDAYIKTIALILPKELTVKVDPLEEMTDAELDRYIKQLAAALTLEVRASEGDADQEQSSRVHQAKSVHTLQ